MRPAPSENEYFEMVYADYGVGIYDNSLAGRMMRAGHLALESQLPKNRSFDRVLELGAGSQAHLPYVKHPYQSYLLTDHDLRNLNRLKKEMSPEVSLEQLDARSEVSSLGSFDRIIACHLLEHLEKPEQVLENWYKALKPGGLLSILVPCDPGLAWRIGRALGPMRSSKLDPKSYRYIMAREHINSVQNLDALIDYRFEKLKRGWSPLGLPSYDLNLFLCFQIEK